MLGGYVLSTTLRTCTCGDLSTNNIGTPVELSGWVHSYRDHGGVIFIDLRDRYGITQIVFDEPASNQKLSNLASTLRREWSIQVKGNVRKRAEGMANPKLETGEIEVVATDLTVFNKSEVPPFEIDDSLEISEEARYRYRYIDIRRPSMMKKLLFRHNAANIVRNFLSAHGFMEVETPLLVRSTPEGARDFVVPSRVHPGEFYALPQSPQLYKQILMVSGIDRYFQIARCLRDEDLRSDRQPEHTQIDLEMSYVKIDDIHKVVESMISTMFKNLLDVEVPATFEKIEYKDSMAMYGTDKPDLRIPIVIKDVSTIVAKSDFSVFQSVCKSGGVVRCISVPCELSRKELDDYIAFAQKNGAKGMAWMKVTEIGLESNIVKFFSQDLQKELIETTNSQSGSVLMFVADKEKVAADVLGKLRIQVAKDKNLIKNPNEFRLAWIVNFPLFEYNEDTKAWEPAHHMFTMPDARWVDNLKENPGAVTCTQFDLVLNGVELGSGSVRINNPEIQEKVMAVVGFPKEVAQERFGFLLDAMKYGAPPHGGMGIGFDRLVALMQGLTDIREVIAFPKTSSAVSLLDNSPSNIPEKQLEELHVKIIKPKK